MREFQKRADDASGENTPHFIVGQPFYVSGASFNLVRPRDIRESQLLLQDMGYGILETLQHSGVKDADTLIDRMEAVQTDKKALPVDATSLAEEYEKAAEDATDLETKMASRRLGALAAGVGALAMVSAANMINGQVDEILVGHAAQTIDQMRDTMRIEEHAAVELRRILIQLTAGHTGQE